MNHFPNLFFVSLRALRGSHFLFIFLFPSPSLYPCPTTDTIRVVKCTILDDDARIYIPPITKTTDTIKSTIHIWDNGGLHIALDIAASRDDATTPGLYPRITGLRILSSLRSSAFICGSPSSLCPFVSLVDRFYLSNPQTLPSGGSHMPTLDRLKETIRRYPDRLSTRKLAQLAGISTTAMSRIINHNQWPTRADKIQIQRRISAHLRSNGILHGDELWFPAPSDADPWRCKSCNRETIHHAKDLCKRCYDKTHRQLVRARQTSIGKIDTLEEAYALVKSCDHLKNRINAIVGEIHRLKQELAEERQASRDLQCQLAAAQEAEDLCAIALNP